MTTGISLAGSGVIAGAMLVYSYLNFREIKADQHHDNEASTATS